MATKAFETVEEAVEYLFSDEIEADMIALPPEVDELTDEENIEDDMIGNSHVTDIAGTTEILHTEDQKNLPHVTSKKIKKEDIRWCDQSPSFSFPDIGQRASHLSEEMKQKLSGLSPVQVFEEIFSEDIVNLIVEETERYAREYRNKINFSVHPDEIRVFIGFLIFTGYHKLCSERDYWSEDEDLGIQMVKDSMSRNRYLELKSVLHFNDNRKANENKHDKAFKIKPLAQALVQNYQKWGIFQENLSVDEMIVRYYGHHPIKQFIRMKPIRFGYKFWALCGNDGYCYNFLLYCGKCQTDEEEFADLSLGSKVVLKMLSIVEDPKSYRVFFDNYFTSHDLLVLLKEQGYRASGTIRENRTKKCPLPADNVMKKKERGYFEFKFDKKNEILITKWNDNKCFSLATNFDTVFPTVQVQRWSSSQRAKISVAQPHAINTYKNFMGGVDLHDWLLEKHTIAVRGKKWYWCLFTRMIDMTVINAHLAFKRCNENNSLPVKEFRRHIARAYLKKGLEIRSARGRPTNLSSSHTSNIADIRYDQKLHIIQKRDKQRRCQFENCKGKPRTYCGKCNVTLCIDCFPKYHTIH